MLVKFTGKNRAETKRRALGYWVENQARLGLSMRDFLARCAMSADGTAIVFDDTKPASGRRVSVRP